MPTKVQEVYKLHSLKHFCGIVLNKYLEADVEEPLVTMPELTLHIALTA